MKKIFILFICMTFMMSLFSIGIGVQGGVSIDIWEGKTVNTGASGEGAVTIRFAEDSPFVLGLGGYGGFSRFNAFADWWMINSDLGGKTNRYFGLGVYAGASLNPFALEIGARLPIGITAFFLNNLLEGYVQAVPSVGFGIGTNYSSDQILAGMKIFVPINLGLRVWLNNLPDFSGVTESVATAQKTAKTNINKGLSGLQSLQAGMMQTMFSTVFSTVFCVGGIYLDYTSLEEGQGLVWYQELEDESSSADLTTEVALLKKLDNGDSWWYIAMSDDEGKTEYEGLLDSQQRVKRIRYKEDGEIEEYVFPVPTNPTENSSSLGGLGMVGLGVTFTPETVNDFVQGEEKITVGAGTYTAKKSIYEYGSSKDMTSYKWYFTENVPGMFIKYDHALGNKRYSRGELKSFKNNYKTKFDSF